MIKQKKQQKVKELKDKVISYEQKKRAEEAFYKSLSPVRKFFAGRPPVHHQAVEYMVHVKKRLKEIDAINDSILELDREISRLSREGSEGPIELPGTVLEEIREFRKSGDHKE